MAVSGAVSVGPRSDKMVEDDSDLEAAGRLVDLAGRPRTL